jgi:hypothetical protein
LITSCLSYRTPGDDSPCPVCVNIERFAVARSVLNREADVKNSDVTWKLLSSSPSLLFTRYRGYFPGVKRPGREAEPSTHLHLVTRSRMRRVIHPPTPMPSFKHRDNFTSYIIQHQMGRTWKEAVVACFMVSLLSQHLVGKDWGKPQNNGNDSSCTLKFITDIECVEIQYPTQWCHILTYIGWFKIIVGVSVAYNFQTGNNKIKLLTKYEGVTQKFYLATLYSPRWCLGENMTSYLKLATSLQNSVWKRSTFRCYPTLVKAISRDW